MLNNIKSEIAIWLSHFFFVHLHQKETMDKKVGDLIFFDFHGSFELYIINEGEHENFDLEERYIKEK